MFPLQNLTTVGLCVEQVGSIPLSFVDVLFVFCFLFSLELDDVDVVYDYNTSCCRVSDELNVCGGCGRAVQAGTLVLSVGL